MSMNVPVLNASKAPESEFYVMECTLTVVCHEQVGDISSEKRVDLQGYLSKEVLEATLDIMREVISE